MKLQKNKGVALIMVLLFMLVATIAATAVFKWIQAQNRASASMLRQNEAYHASLAGINAARSWLSFNGQETAALVTQFEKDKTPILLDSILTPLQSGMQQGFSVYLTNVDASNSSDVKLKIVSVGRGLNKSVYSQVAILSVNGLYQIKVPVKISNSKTAADYNAAYFGGSTQFQGEHKGTAMMINGDWKGNPGELDEDFIVTGNVELSGDKISIGKTACVGGNLVTSNNGTHVNNIYVGGNAPGMDLAAKGNAYFEGDVIQGNKSDTVSGNMTLNGMMRLNLSGYEFVVGGNLCLTDKGKIDFSSSTNHDFTAVGNVWVPGANDALQPMEGQSLDAGRARHRYLGGPGKDVYVETSRPCKDKDFLYDYVGRNNYDQTTFFSGGNVSNSLPSKPPFECAESVKDYCYSKWKPTANGCDGSKFKIDDMLTTGYNQFKSFANKAQCTRDVLNSSTTQFDATKMSQCYDEQVKNADSNKTNLYNGYMVIQFTGGSESGATQVLGSVSGKLNGKFIFLFETKVTYNFNVPETTDNSYVFVYMKEGCSAEIKQGGNTGPWNYFFFLEKNVHKLLSHKDWNGSFYAVAGSAGDGNEGNCAKIEFMDGGGKLNFDPELMQDMIDAGIICNYGEACTPSAGGGGSSSADGETSGASNGYDKQWISYGPRVKISLASQYANKESFQYGELNPSLIVMPRLIYLPKNKKLYENGNYQYSVLYLGGIKNPSNDGSFAGNVSCYVGNSLKSGASIGRSELFNKTGLHTCEYTEYVNGFQLSSTFWVWVIDESASTVVSFAKTSDDLTCSEEGNSRQISVNIENSGNEGTLKVLVYNTTSMGVSVTPNTTYLQNRGTSGYITTYEFAVPNNTTNISDLFTVTKTDCDNASGLVQFQIVDELPEDLVFVGSPSNLLYTLAGPQPNVMREEISKFMSLDAHRKDSLDNIPNCTDIDGGMTGDEAWSAKTIENNPGGCKNRVDKSVGPWLCNIGETIDDMTAEGYDHDLCEVVQANHPQVAGGDIMTYVYASLKARPLTLTIDVSGLKGSVITDTVNSWHKEYYKENEDSEEIEIAVIDDHGTELGVCRTGGMGKCVYTTYAGGTYHLKARSINFSHFGVYCNNAKCQKTEYRYEGGDRNKLVLVMKEDTKVKANFNKTGYCFTENFKKLYSYCSQDVTPKAYYEGPEPKKTWDPNNPKARGGWYWNSHHNDSVKNTPKGYRNTSDFVINDVGHGIVNGDTAFCIDQCVTTKNYRYTGNPKTGVPESINGQQMRFYPIVCSVTGNKDIPSDESAAYKEDQNRDYWSYWDPGERLYPSPKASSSHYACAKYAKCEPVESQKECLSDYCYGPDPLPGPRVRGGYYPPDDPYSPWMRVFGVHQSQTTKAGPILNDRRISWNTKPYINRDEGLMTAAHGGTTPNVTLRKSAAGYNGTYTKKFRIIESSATYSWGSGNTFIFRSNPSATSFYHAAIIPGDQIEKNGRPNTVGNSRSPHVMICYCTDETCPAYIPTSNYSRGWGSAVNFATPWREKGKQPYNIMGSNPGNGYVDFWHIDGGTDNLGHCAVAPVATNIPFDQLLKRDLELKVDLNDDTAYVTLAYASDVSSVAGSNATSFMIYSKTTFNLNDPELFGYKKSMGYKETETPMYKFKHNVNGAQDSAVYVGFSMHNKSEVVYNIEWRSGGNCRMDLQMQPQIYCGFENNTTLINRYNMPVHYVYDYCPEDAECECEFKFWDADNNSAWYGTMSEARNYREGALTVRATCRVIRPGANGATREEMSNIYGSCKAFRADDPDAVNSCTETYKIFTPTKTGASELADFIDMYDSKISAIDNSYAYTNKKSSVTITPNSVGSDNEFGLNVGDYTASSENEIANYAVNWYLNDSTSYYKTVNKRSDIKRIQGAANINGDSLPKLLKLAFNVEGAWHNPDPQEKGLPNESGVDTLYLKLKDKNATPYLNLRDANLKIRFAQTWNMDSVQYWLQDIMGNNSPVMNINTNYGKATEENKKLYLEDENGIITVGSERGAYGIPAECYSINRPSQSFAPDLCSDVEIDGKHYNCCQEGLVWWLDAKGKGIYRETSIGSMNFDWYKGITPDFDVERVSKIFFRLVNRDEAHAGETDIRANRFNGNLSKTGTGAFIHVGEITSVCPNDFNLENCKVVNGEGENNFFVGESVKLTANVTNCSEAEISSDIDGFNVKPGCVGMDTIVSPLVKLSPLDIGDKAVSLTVSSYVSNWLTKTCTAYFNVNPLESKCTWVGTESKNYLENPDFVAGGNQVLLVEGSTDKVKIEMSFENANENLRLSLFKDGIIFRGKDGNAVMANKTLSQVKSFTPSGSGRYEFRYGTKDYNSGKTYEHTGIIGDGNCYVDVVYVKKKDTVTVQKNEIFTTDPNKVYAFAMPTTDHLADFVVENFGEEAIIRISSNQKSYVSSPTLRRRMEVSNFWNRYGGSSFCSASAGCVIYFTVDKAVEIQVDGW